MAHYLIESKASATMGVYSGDTPDEAFAAMLEDAGYDVGDIGSDEVGTIDDWHVDEVRLLGTTRTERENTLMGLLGSEATRETASAVLDAANHAHACAIDDRGWWLLESFDIAEAAANV